MFFFTLFTALYSTLCTKTKKNLQKNLLDFYIELTIKKFHGNSVKNKSAMAKKSRRGVKRPPPPA